MKDYKAITREKVNVDPGASRYFTEAIIPSDHVKIISITPHNAGDGGILTMPLRANVPNPKSETWELTTCPVCEAECWLTDIAREAIKAEPDLRTACTVCALKAGIRP